MTCLFPHCKEPAAGPREKPVLCRAHFVEMLRVTGEATGGKMCVLCGSNDNVEVHQITLTANLHTKLDGAGDFPICARCFVDVKAHPSFRELKGES